MFLCLLRTPGLVFVESWIVHNSREPEDPEVGDIHFKMMLYNDISNYQSPHQQGPPIEDAMAMGSEPDLLGSSLHCVVSPVARNIRKVFGWLQQL